MQSNPQKLWIANPSAASLEIGAAPDFTGEIRIDNQMSILAASVTLCDIECAAPCVEDVWTVTFEDVDFGTCNDCGKSVGIKVILERHSDFDNQTYLDYIMQKLYLYDGDKTGVVTGATIASNILAQINALANQSDQHDQFFVSAAIGTNPEDLVLTYPCSGLVSYLLEGIFLPDNHNLPTTEQPTVVHTTEGQDAVLSREQLLRDFPYEGGHVFGEAPRESFTWCQTICVIRLRGCIDACSNFFDNQNSGHLHTGATPFDLYLYVNSAAPGFGAFIAALNTNIASCQAFNSGAGLPADGGYQSGVRVTGTGAGTAVNMSEFTFSASGTPFTIVSGGLVINTTGTSGANLAANINAIMGAAVAVYAAPNLTLSAPIDVLGQAITVSSPEWRNYAGE